MPGSTPATSQLDWLSSTTAMIVLSWSKATRDLLKSFSGGIRGTPSVFGQRRWCHLLRRLPHTISPLEGAGFEPSVPRQKDNAFRDSSFPTCARATAAFENARRPSSSCFFQFVDPVRMNSELTRQLGDRPVPRPCGASVANHDRRDFIGGRDGHSWVDT